MSFGQQEKCFKLVVTQSGGAYYAETLLYIMSQLMVTWEYVYMITKDVLTDWGNQCIDCKLPGTFFARWQWQWSR